MYKEQKLIDEFKNYLFNEIVEKIQDSPNKSTIIYIYIQKLENGKI